MGGNWLATVCLTCFQSLFCLTRSFPDSCSSAFLESFFRKLSQSIVGSEVDRHHFLDFSITNILSPSCLLIYDQPLPHRTTALDPIQQRGRQPRLIFLLGLDSTWADGNSIFTPMQPSNQPGTPNDEKVELTDSFEAIGTMMCTGLSQVQAPRTESKRKTECPCQCHGE